MEEKVEATLVVRDGEDVWSRGLSEYSTTKKAKPGDLDNRRMATHFFVVKRHRKRRPELNGWPLSSIHYTGDHSH